MTAVIEVEGLRKEYRRRKAGRVRAVDDVTLSVPAGGVFGFLGPNGSGKTTTIRCVLGLSRPSDGHCRLLGAESPRRLPSVIGRVGSLVETPGLTSGVTARQTLEILATAAGIGPSRVDAVLERVGLAERAEDRARGYSLGMRQRLAIAGALLTPKDLLVLDEPTNGLDPQGTREVRQLVGSLAGDGATVLVSSHLLGEVELVCDQVAILSGGRTVASGPIDNVLGAARPTAVWVKVADLAGGSRTLMAAGLGAEVDGEHIRVAVAPPKSESVTRVLVADGHVPSEIRPVETSLEDAFFALTDSAVR
jgi:ABC-2 type transport system ATP-binding protein